MTKRTPSCPPENVKARDKNGKPICGARTKRKGTPCTQDPMQNGRCRLHGGATPGGIASPHFKTGRWSKHLPAQLAEHYQAALADQDLLALREDLALLDARLAQVLGKLREADASKIKETEAEVWGEVAELLEQRRRTVESERKRLVDMQQMITYEDAMLFVTVLSDSVRRHVTDPKQLASIAADIARLVVFDAGRAHRWGEDEQSDVDAPSGATNGGVLQ